MQLPDGTNVIVRKHALDQFVFRYCCSREVRNPLSAFRSCLSGSERFRPSLRRMIRYKEQYGVVGQHWINEEARMRFVVVWNGYFFEHSLVTASLVKSMRGWRR